jgi:hypothetical protein
MLLTRTRQLYFPIRTSGGGLYNYSIGGRGIFQNSIKTIGKYALFGLNNLSNSSPRRRRAVTAGNEALLEKNKDKIQKVINDESKQILGKLLKRKKVKKEYKNTPKLTEKSKEILKKLIYGDGLKLLK